MKRTSYLALSSIVILLITGVIPLCAQQYIPFPLEKGTRLTAMDTDRPFSNGGVELMLKSDSLWFGGGKGLELTTDFGNTWKHFGDEGVFNDPSYSTPLYQDGIAALGSYGPVIWASLAGSFDVGGGQTLPQGLGLAVSTDDGATWTHIAQPMEDKDAKYYTIKYGNNELKALAVTVDVQNITYDLAVTKDAVWTANFAGGLRKSTDLGKTWQLVVLPPDNLNYITPDSTYDFTISPVSREFTEGTNTVSLRESFNHRVFSVMADGDSVLWVGTAGGINRSTDGGVSWRKFTFDNQTNAISGNFVIAFARSYYQGKEYIWASTINATQSNEYRAVSYTTDQGAHWSTALRGEFTNGFGVKDSIVYALTKTGIYRTADGGRSWTHYSTFVDRTHRQQVTNQTCYDAVAQGDNVWIATNDGIMRTVDSPSELFGTHWDIFRAWQDVGTPSEAYAYPNPFSPDDEVCRIHYKTDQKGTVSIKIYDYAMFPVRTVVEGASRPPGQELDEIWDGKTDSGKRAANGVYYIQVKAGDTDAAWAKVIVLQ